MGGSGSGRYRTRNSGALNAARRLDIRHMRRRGLLRPGAAVDGTMAWTRGGQDMGRVGLRLDLTNGDSGLLTVAFKLNGEPRRQEVIIASRPMRFGGKRFYFQCPETFRRCEVLALMGGVFASRRAHRLTYQSQSDDRLGRMRDRADRLRAQLWPTDRGRPRGRRRQRLESAWCDASVAADDLLEGTLHRFQRWL